MVIEAAAQRRDRSAWQVARAVRDTSVRSYADLTGAAADGVAARGAEAMNMHAFRLWKRAFRKK